MVLDQVRKPIRDLRKSLHDLPGDPAPKAVHKLRTRARRVEALVAALQPQPKKGVRRLLKSIKPLRKAAGKVRDMDVLEAKVGLLVRRCPDPLFEQLLEHLRSGRKKRAHKLSKAFAAERKTICRCLRKFSQHVEDEFSQASQNTRQAQILFEELRNWPKLTAANLHDFRIKIKELRSMLQLFDVNDEKLLKALENAKMRIGTWHDLEELHKIAAEELDADSEHAAIAAIAEVEAKKFGQAMRAAQSLRTRYLRTHSPFES